MAKEIGASFGVDDQDLVAAVRLWTAHYHGGNMWAQDDCFLTSFRDVLGLGLQQYTLYRAWEAASIHGGFRYLHQEFCLVSDFPERICQDELRRPHCADGPSHRWRDGFEAYYWHGVPVPKEWIRGPRPSASVVFQDENAERRRAGLEILGWTSVLEELGARTIDEDPDPMIGTLLEVDLPDAPGARFVRVRCGTGRDFALPVPPELETAAEANAWTYGIDAVALRAMQMRT
jgi:hypothetical protein